MPELDVRLASTKEAAQLDAKGAHHLNTPEGRVYVSPKFLPNDAKAALRFDLGGIPGARTIKAEGLVQRRFL